MTHEERRLLCIVARKIANDAEDHNKTLSDGLRGLLKRVQRHAMNEEHQRNLKALADESAVRFRVLSGDGTNSSQGGQ